MEPRRIAFYIKEENMGESTFREQSDGALCFYSDLEEYVKQEVGLVKKENERLREALEKSLIKPETMQNVMRENNIAINDLKDPMQKLAFTLYTELVELKDIAQAALKQTEGGGTVEQRQEDVCTKLRCRYCGGPLIRLMEKLVCTDRKTTACN
jgi:hypothetical protein